MKAKTAICLSVGFVGFSTVFYLVSLASHHHIKAFPYVIFFSLWGGTFGFLLVRKFFLRSGTQPNRASLFLAIALTIASLCVIWRAYSPWPLKKETPSSSKYNSWSSLDSIVVPGKSVKIQLADIDSISKLWTYSEVSVTPANVDGKYKWLSSWNIPQRANQNWSKSIDIYGTLENGERRLISKSVALDSRQGSFTKQNPYIVLFTEASDNLFGKQAKFHVKMNVRFPRSNGSTFANDSLEIDSDFSFAFATRDQAGKRRIFQLLEGLEIVGLCALPVLVALLFKNLRDDKDKTKRHPETVPPHSLTNP